MIRNLLIDLLLGPAAAVVAESDAAFLVFVVACCLGGLGLGAGIAWVQIKWMKDFGFGVRPLLGAVFGLALTGFASIGLSSLVFAYFKA